jgi:predicted dienelactone hydrolase
MRNYWFFFWITLTISLFNKVVNAQNPGTFVYGDALPDAPELSFRGEFKVGVRTLDFINKNQVDVLKSKGGIDPLYDRPLKVEVWYPASLGSKEPEIIKYDEFMGTANDPKRPLIPFSFSGRAARDAAPMVSANAYPLLIVSHGYVGSRFIMSYLTENLASKGFIVVAIDHTESTFRDAGGFPSTLVNRSKDILFILNQMSTLSKIKNHFLNGILDDQNIGLIGYSMGGYGVLNVAGAAYSEASVKLFGAMTQGSKAIEVRTQNHPEFKSSIDPRIKAVVAFAPWGMERGVWDSETLKGLQVPTFFIAGNQDDISGYEKGVKAIFNAAINSKRFMLVYDNARHNIAPNPPPAESLKPGLHFDEYYRYAEPAWNEKRINNINQHFVTAFLGIHLQQKDYQKFLDLPQSSNEKGWKGFKPRSSTGLELLKAEKAF